MKRSHSIPLRLVPIVAAAFVAGCGTPQRRTCVDQTGKVVADANCEGQQSQGTGTSWDAPNSYPYYHWYWHRGWGWYSPFIGNRTPFAGGFSAPSTRGTTRGGFGATAAGHAGAGS
jgi:hypothetical protein